MCSFDRLFQYLFILSIRFGSSPCMTETKLKSVSFPDNTLVTIWPNATNKSSSDISCDKDLKCSRPSNSQKMRFDAVVRALNVNGNEYSGSPAVTAAGTNGNITRHIPLMKIGEMDSPGKKSNEDGNVFEKPVNRQYSSGTFFSNLRKENVERADSVDGTDSLQEDWKVSQHC